MLSACHYSSFSKEDIENVLEQWKQAKPILHILALLPESETEHIPVLQKLCRQKQIQLSGAVFPSLIYDSEWKTSGILLFQLSEPVPHFILPDIPDPETTATQIASFVAKNKSQQDELDKQTLFLIFNTLTPSISKHVDEIYLELADDVNYAGINAGSEMFEPIDCLFTESECYQTGVLCILLSKHAAFALEHGFQPPETVITATATDGDRIINIDWQPAFNAYQDLVSSHFGTELTKENFYQFGSYFPLGILQANNRLIVRLPVAIADDLSIQCVGDVPPNTPLVLLEGQYQACQNCSNTLTELLEQCGVEKHAPLVTFYCAGRKMFLGDAATEELIELKNKTGAAFLVGAVSLGEIGSRRRWEYPLFHNAAILCAGWKSEC